MYLSKLCLDGVHAVPVTERLFCFHILLIISHGMNTISQTEVGTPFGLSPRTAVLLQRQVTHCPYLFDTGFASNGTRKLSFDHSNVYKYLKGRCHEDDAGLFLVVPSGRMRSKGCTLKCKKFYLSLRKNFFTWKVADH